MRTDRTPPTPLPTGAVGPPGDAAPPSLPSAPDQRPPAPGQNASGKTVSGQTASEEPAPGTVALCAFVAAISVALALALQLPAATTVFGLALFGLLHNVTELRYVLGRFGGVLAGPLLKLLLALCTGIVLCRAVPASELSRAAEICLAYGLLGLACRYGLRGRPMLLTGACAVLGLAAACSLANPAHHFVVLTHLHNLVPLLFLWEWSRQLARGRRLFRALQLVWVVVLPLLLLLGALDGLLAERSAETDRLSAAHTPPAWTDSPVALRFLAVFAFLQTMHYVVWVWFLPRYAPAATASFERRVPVLRGVRVWLLGLAGTVALAALFASDYATGKQLYAAVATYHAYLEFPVLLTLVLGLTAQAHTRAPTRTHADTHHTHRTHRPPPDDPHTADPRLRTSELRSGGGGTGPEPPPPDRPERDQREGRPTC